MKRTLAVILGSLLLGVAGFYFGVRQDLLDFASYGPAVWRPELVLLGLASLFVMWGAPSWRLSVLSRIQGSKLPFYLALPVQIATIFGAVLTPGNTGGAPATVIALNRLGIPLGQGFSITVQTVVLDLVFFAWSVPTSLLYLLVSQELRLPIITWILAFFLVGVFIFLAIVLGYYPRLMVRLLLWLSKLRILRRFRRGVRATARDYYRSAGRFTQIAWQQGLALHVLTALGWLGGFTLFWALLAVFDNHIRPQVLFAVLDLIVLVGNIVPTPGGSGFMEAVVGLSTKAQTGAVAVAAPLLIWRFMTFYAIYLLGPIATGFIYFVSRRQRFGGHAGAGES